MVYRVLIILCSFFALSSCGYDNTKNDPRLLSLLNADALYISNQENVHIENEYYNALLEIKKRFPGKLEEIVVLTDQDIKNLEEQLQINTYPTLLLINQQVIITKIEGNHNQDSIIKEMSLFLKGN